MIWFKKKSPTGPRPLLSLTGRRHLAEIGQALTVALALFVILAAWTQQAVPGFLTDRVAPGTLVGLALLGVGLGALAPMSRAQYERLRYAAVALAGLAGVAAWHYLAFLPAGRAAYTMLVVGAGLLLAWPRPVSKSGDNE